MATKKPLPVAGQGILKHHGQLTATMKGAKVLQVDGFDWQVKSQGKRKTVSFFSATPELNEPSLIETKVGSEDDEQMIEEDADIESVHQGIVRDLDIKPVSASLPDISSKKAVAKKNWSMSDILDRRQIETKGRGMQLPEPKQLVKKKKAEPKTRELAAYEKAMHKNEEEELFDSAYESYFGLSMKFE
jgi:hypothetical protein